MTSEKENFDEIIRQKFSEHEFIFNEENWEKMEEKIVSSRKYSKNVLWGSIFSIGLITGVGIMFLFTNIFTDNSSSIADNNIHNSTNSISTNSESNSNNANLSSSENNNTLNITTNTESENNSDNNVITVNENEAAITNESSSNNTAKEAAQPSANTKNNVTSNKTAINNNNKVQNNNKPVTSNNNVTNNNSGNLNAVEKISKNETPTTSNTNNNIASNNNSTDNSNAVNTNNTADNSNLQSNSNTNSNVAPEILSENKADNKQDGINQTTSATSDEKNNNTSETTLTVNVKAFNADGTPVDAATQSTLAETNKEKKTEEPNLDEIVSETDLAKDETFEASNNFRNNDATPANPALPGLSSSTYITASVGTNYTFGWSYPNVTEARGFNLVAGVGVTHFINPKWTINVEAQYGSIGYLKDSKKTFSNKDYGFGSSTIDTTINTNYLHYIVMPLMVEYNLNSKNSLLFGGTVSYLTNSNSNITINASSVGPPPSDLDTAMNVSKTSVKGYYNGAFNKFDATLGVGYRRRLGEKFSVAAIANFGLLDIKKDNFFGVNKVERNSGVKLIFTYNIFGLK